MSTSQENGAPRSTGHSAKEESAPKSLTEEVESATGVDIEVDMRMAIVGGAVASLVAFVGAYFVGRLSGVEGTLLLEAMMPSARFLCSAMMTATATILALMLTALGLSSNTESTMRASHYKRVKQIALVDTIAFIGATLFLLLITIPLSEAKDIPTGWYTNLYYFVLVTSSILGGLLVSVVLMLYNAVTDLINVVGLGATDNPFVAEEEEESSS